ncbi:DUF805 domain-containing protein [Pseudomonas sp. ICMP 561]|uniref:DUF805 domain-containing protein n=1 Tax=Pseudomonas sp. ICMP 561 TaxID=1718918 RepID=UPI000C06D276|nr:DUF805 domain-containing protein [Pseudomonas sp. ICMP 561]PHN29715.1 hypothetical protein AO242_01470 [Pseudomonas sp. ICMP 561]
MTTPLFKIVFEGQLRNGVELQTAKLNLASLFKSEVSAVDNLFSGKPVALKRGLTQADAQVYLKALNDAGVEARIDSDPVIILNIEEVEETSPTLQSSQPVPTSPYAPPRASVIDDETKQSELKIFSFQGRIGRVRYLAWISVLVVTGFIAAGICSVIMSASLVGGGLLLAIVGAAFFLVGLQIGAQRLHDAGWSAWLLCLYLVPYIGFVLPLLLIFAPGNKGANRYGPPPPPNNRGVILLACMWILFIGVSVITTLTGGFLSLKEELSDVTTQYEQSLPDDDQ